MKLEEYIKTIMKNPFMNLCPPFFDGISKGVQGIEKDKYLMGCVIDRRDNFQVELFVIPKDIKEIGLHTHPDVDSYEMHVSGVFEFVNEGITFPPDGLNGGPLSNRNILKVNFDSNHGGNILEGAAFLSFQEWKNNTKPTSVAYNFKE